MAFVLNVLAVLNQLHYCCDFNPETLEIYCFKSQAARRRLGDDAGSQPICWLSILLS